MSFEPGKYVACVYCNGDAPNYDTEHFVTVHPDGTITESHYVSHWNKGKTTHFDPPRVWSPEALEEHHVVPFTESYHGQ